MIAHRRSGKYARGPRPSRGEVTAGLTVNQVFLTFTLIYILLPALIVVLSLLLKPRVNRIVNIVMSLLYLMRRPDLDHAASSSADS